MIDAGYQDFADRWNPILDVFDEVGVRFAHEVHPSEIAYDYWTTERDARGDRPPAGVRAQLGPEPLRLAGPRPGRVPLGLPRPHLPRRLQGREASQLGNGRNGRLGSHLPGPTRGAAGTSSPPVTATCRGRTCFRTLNAIGYDGPDLDRVGGRRHGPARRRPRGAGVRPPARHRPAGGRLRRRVHPRLTGGQPCTARSRAPAPRCDASELAPPTGFGPSPMQRSLSGASRP